MSMDHRLRRDPRRPYVITSDGIRRIVLGATAEVAVSSHDGSHTTGAAASPSHSAHAGATPKPVRTAEAAHDYILVIAFSERGVLDEHPRQAVTAAALLASPQTAVVVVVLGELHEDLAPYGADIVVVLPDCDLRQFRPEHALSRLSDPLKQYPPAHVLIPDRLNGEGDLGRRLAAAYGASVATHVVEISPDHVAAYQLVQDSSGRPARRLARRPLPDVILLEPNAVDTRLPFVGAGQRIDDMPAGTNVTSPAAAAAQTHIADAPHVSDASRAAGASGTADPSRTSAPSAYRDGGLRALEASDLPLEEADLIASAGNGVTDVGLFRRLAKALGAATGASRVAVDDGRFPRDKQIGATGKTVSANAYIAIGISGAVQHLQGIKDCRHVIAINRDIAAPMIQRADLSIIGDAQKVMQALLEAVEAARANRAADDTSGTAAQSATQERAA
jgi:electron transfer flavoprotein alpha subunit